jgi:cell division protease FtsH
MVCEWGMSEKMGPLTYGAKEEEIFLGREITRHRDFSEQTAIAIDGEVRCIVSDCMQRAETILTNHIDTLHRLAKALLEREILDGVEVDKVIQGEELPPVKQDDGSGAKKVDLSSRAEEIKKAVEEIRKADEQKAKEMTPVVNSSDIKPSVDLEQSEGDGGK